MQRIWWLPLPPHEATSFTDHIRCRSDTCLGCLPSSAQLSATQLIKCPPQSRTARYRLLRQAVSGQTSGSLRNGPIRPTGRGREDLGWAGLGLSRHGRYLQGLRGGAQTRMCKHERESGAYSVRQVQVYFFVKPVACFNAFGRRWTVTRYSKTWITFHPSCVRAVDTGRVWESGGFGKRAGYVSIVRSRSAQPADPRQQLPSRMGLLASGCILKTPSARLSLSTGVGRTASIMHAEGTQKWADMLKQDVDDIRSVDSNESEGSLRHARRMFRRAS